VDRDTPVSRTPTELVAPHQGAATFEEFLHVHKEIRNRVTHDQLQKGFN
jgi:hypothetical protein